MSKSDLEKILKYKKYNNIPNGVKEWLLEHEDYWVAILSLKENLKLDQEKLNKERQKIFLDEKNKYSPALVVATSKHNNGAYGIIKHWNFHVNSYKNAEYWTRVSKTHNLTINITQLHKDNKVVACSKIKQFGDNITEYYIGLAGYHHENHYSPFKTVELVCSQPELRDKISLIVEDQNIYHVDKLKAIMPMVWACLT